MTRFPFGPVKSYRGWVRRVLARIGFGTLAMLAVPLLVLFLWLRLFGLPDSAKNYLLGAIERRHIFPFPVDVDRFLLDATGAVLAEHVTVYRDAARKSVMFQVDEARVSIAWLSWWRGRGVINGASISNADVRYPVGSETADFHQVNADIAFDGHDIKIENAQAQFLDLALYIRGTIHNDGFPKTKPPTPEQMHEREAILRSVLRAVDDVGVERPIDVQLEFETSTHNLGGGRANFILEGQHLTWRTAPVDELSIHGSLNDGVVDLSDFKIALQRGELSAYGEWNIAGFHDARAGLHRAARGRAAQTRFSLQRARHGGTRAIRPAPGRSHRRAGRPGLARFHLQSGCLFPPERAAGLRWEAIAHSRLEGGRDGRECGSGTIFRSHQPDSEHQRAHRFHPGPDDPQGRLRRGDGPVPEQLRFWGRRTED
jgi:hypothetical protein